MKKVVPSDMMTFSKPEKSVSGGSVKKASVTVWCLLSIARDCGDVLYRKRMLSVVVGAKG